MLETPHDTPPYPFMPSRIPLTRIESPSRSDIPVRDAVGLRAIAAGDRDGAFGHLLSSSIHINRNAIGRITEILRNDFQPRLERAIRYPPKKERVARELGEAPPLI